MGDNETGSPRNKRMILMLVVEEEEEEEDLEIIQTAFILPAWMASNKSTAFKPGFWAIRGEFQ